MSCWNRCGLCFIFIFGVQATYRIKVVSLKKCENIESKMDKSVDLKYFLGARKVSRQTALIQVNYTISNKIMGPMFYSFRCYEIQQNGIKLVTQVISKVSCKNPIAAQFIKILEVNIDKDCYIPPGTYVVKDINLDEFSWFFIDHMVNVGRYGFEVDMATDKGIVACISLLLYIVKRK